MIVPCIPERAPAVLVPPSTPHTAGAILWQQNPQLHTRVSQVVPLDQASLVVVMERSVMLGSLAAANKSHCKPHRTP